MYIRDVQASRIQRYLAERRKGGLSIRSSNFYLQAIKQFLNWMVADGRTAENPLAYLKGQNPNTDIRHNRRALEPDEIRRLLETTKAAGKRFGMKGYERALLYRLAAESGLRADELRSLKVSSFDFKNRIVSIKSGCTKNKKEVVMPLRPDTAVELKDFFKGKIPNVKAFGGTRKQLTKRTSDMIKADLEDAGIPYVDDSERYADFHSLRHTTGSLLAASGVHPKIAQSIMRHSDINLTMSLYTHTLRGQESEAIENLPDLSLPSMKKKKATGTDDLPADSAYKPAYKKLTKNAYFDKNELASDVAIQRANTAKSGGFDMSDNLLSSEQLGSGCHPLTTEKRRGRDSNPRYGYEPVRRFSKPLPSATRPPLHVSFEFVVVSS